MLTASVKMGKYDYLPYGQVQLYYYFDTQTVEIIVAIVVYFFC